uniref:Transposase n=1 Tax=Globodera rostochiensis TaxID=31243 RepID=A0A914HP84_GLORO
MEEFWILILVSFVATNSFDKAESVQLEELPLNPLDEIFGEGWWDNAKDEEWHKLTLEHNLHHQIDRQNTQIEPNSIDQNPPLTESDHSGRIEPNSTDQNPPLTESDHSGRIEPNSTDQNAPLTESDHSGRIEPNSTDQNPPLTESDHSDNAKNGEEISSNEKRKIVDEFHAMKDQFNQKGKFSVKERNQIELKIAKHLKVNRTKIYKWKKEFGLSQKVSYNKEERKLLVEKFDQMKAELKRAGFKNSYPNQINETVAKKLGFNFVTIYKWKRKLGQTKPNKYPHNKQKELMKRYYEIKDKNPKISDEDIAKILKIGRATLYIWKKLFHSTFL